MNIFFKRNRNQSIESLEFFSLKGTQGKTTNPLILDFLKVLEVLY